MYIHYFTVLRAEVPKTVSWYIIDYAFLVIKRQNNSLGLQFGEGVCCEPSNRSLIHLTKIYQIKYTNNPLSKDWKPQFSLSHQIS